MQFVDERAADGAWTATTRTIQAPYCQVCGSRVGIFIRYSLGWRHYRAAGESGIELFDPGHAPRVGWRATPTATA